MCENMLCSGWSRCGGGLLNRLNTLGRESRAGATARTAAWPPEPRRGQGGTARCGTFSLSLAVQPRPNLRAVGHSLYERRLSVALDQHGSGNSRYLDWLIGPYPQEEERYRERSPLYHVERLAKPVIFFQGDEDAIVPPNQTEAMVEALRRKGNAVGYFLFSGEQHGFRKGANIQRCLDAELAFYAIEVFKTG